MFVCLSLSPHCSVCQGVECVPVGGGRRSEERGCPPSPPSPPSSPRSASFPRHFPNSSVWPFHGRTPPPPPPSLAVASRGRHPLLHLAPRHRSTPHKGRQHGRAGEEGVALLPFKVWKRSRRFSPTRRRLGFRRLSLDAATVLAHRPYTNTRKDLGARRDHRPIFSRPDTARTEGTIFMPSL